MLTAEQIRLTKQVARQTRNLEDLCRRNGLDSSASSMLGAVADSLERQAAEAEADPAVIAKAKDDAILRTSWEGAINRQRNLRHWSVVHALQDDGPDANVNYAAL